MKILRGCAWNSSIETYKMLWSRHFNFVYELLDYNSLILLLWISTFFNQMHLAWGFIALPQCSHRISSLISNIWIVFLFLPSYFYRLGFGLQSLLMSNQKQNPYWRTSKQLRSVNFISQAIFTSSWGSITLNFSFIACSQINPWNQGTK